MGTFCIRASFMLIGATAKIWLRPVSIAHNMGFSAKELRELLRLVRAHQTQLLEAWHGYFGAQN